MSDAGLMRYARGQCTPAWRHHRWVERRRNRHGEISVVECEHCGQRVSGCHHCRKALDSNLPDG